MNDIRLQVAECIMILQHEGMRLAEGNEAYGGRQVEFPLILSSTSVDYLD